ncbi:MAG TPA: MarR family transcriptional regulator, partial [Alphaproteobacteria bacterium]|nr:MarR family transcriptional regulator [Alphaproteobacteria bacterium]
LAQCKTLARLSHNEGINQSALAELLEVQPITLTRLIDRLQEAGLVERRLDPVDRRAFRLHLTAAAEPVLEQIWGISAETQDQAMAGLAPELREHLIAALAVMRQTLMQAEIPPQEETSNTHDDEANAPA